MDDDLIRPRPEVREARLRLVRADVGVAGAAPPARPAPAHEGHRHPLTDVESLDRRPRRGNPPDELMPGHVRQAHRLIVS
ncbi:Uncharacterised protein [Mycobacteroides abscessus subsp. abscessus]|nr:Uncharacterised protein [Mycobacteroides abscessus subsp. abscessus]